jgi:hypothetical protein
MEGKLRCVKFKRVSDARRAFQLALRVTESASTKTGSADDKPGGSLECT